MGYSTWVTKGDISRIAIIYHFGGIYADVDTRCTRNISQLLSNMYKNKKQVVVIIGKLTLAINDFFVATAKHPFFLHVLSDLSEAKRWYVSPYWNTMLTAGSTYFHGRYRNYQSKEQIMTLPDKNEYFIHYSMSSWRKLDGRFIAWLERNFKCIILALLMFIVVFISFKIHIRLRRRKASKSEH